MFKKILLLLLILAPSVLYLYIVNRDAPQPAATEAVQTPAENAPTRQTQSPDY
jgi:hypothetical protein